MADTDAPQAIHRADYRPTPFRSERVDLRFELDPEATIVTCRQQLVRQGPGDLVLLGDGPQILELSVDGRPRASSDYKIEDGRLTLGDLPDSCVLEIKVRIAPVRNTRLMGLYVSSGIFCTQCEAEGFRRITWFQDRPDVMSVYGVRIEADRAKYPVLLSNGNLVETGELAGGRHYALWEDPFPKPAYLFALVAGDLAMLEDRFTTRSGREVTLRIYAEHQNIGQCRHAMDSLIHSMRWDEERYGLEYDLDLFQIVAVSDFNFGAMENKGLNIFNTAATLARADTATDGDFVSVERIIAHEYFHNWTGDRVTCRDWFQLTLKEGLTVFRDQQFTADRHSEAVKRIGDVTLLRESQFAEDAGPLAHPIRPDSYVEINNFYTRTVYEKGAEVIRMIHTLIGEEAFRKGMDIYFERHDGQAVTCEDFVAAMEAGSGRDLGLFRRWYGQAGTPEVTVERHYDPEAQTLTLDIRQHTAPTPGQAVKLPLHLPLRIGLVGKGGEALPVQLQGENEPGGTDRVLEVTDAAQSIVLTGLAEEPVPSLFRNFSAPIRLDAGYADHELGHLLRHDEDAFNRWEAGQTLALRLMLKLIEEARAGRALMLDPILAGAMGDVLADPSLEPAFKARALSLPMTGYLAQQLAVIDPDAIHAALRFVRAELGRALGPALRETWQAMQDKGPFSIEPEAMGRRALKNVALAYLLWSGQGAELAQDQYRDADNMTDSLAALRAIAEAGLPESAVALESFYSRWRQEPLVVNKWFTLQATLEEPGSVERVQSLLEHPAFTMQNPNRVRALLGSFAMGNLTGFHRKDGAGYRLLGERIVALDAKNAQVAARLLTAFGRWRRFDPDRQALMRAELERVLKAPALSRDSFEIASKTLA